MRIFSIAAAMLAFPIWALAQQQAMPGMDMSGPQRPQAAQQAAKPGTASDSESASRDTMTLQEQENPGHHTGASVPSPELLGEVAKRAPMTLEVFLSLAEQNNPTLAQARTQVRRAEQLGAQAGLYPNPTIGYNGEHIRGGEYGGGEQGAYVQQEIVTGGKLGLRRETYRQESRANQIGVEEQTWMVKGGVQQAFFRALASQSLVAVRQSLVQVAEEAVENAHQRANVGQAEAPDVLQAEVEGGKAKVDFVRAQRQYLQDFQMLAAVAGAADLPPAPLAGDLEHPPAMDGEQQVAAILADSPTVKRAQQEVAVAEARLKDAKREAVPNITVRAGEWWSGEMIESSRRPAGPESFVDAGIKLPLWNRNQGNVEAAKAELERSKEDVARTRLALKQEAAPLAQEYLAAQFEADLYRTELLPRGRRAYELYLMKYQQMASAYPEVLMSQKMLLQLQADYLRSLGAVWMNAIALQNYTLTGGLDQPVSMGATSTTLNLPNGGGNE